MTIGSNQAIYYDPGNPLSMLDAIQEEYVAKVTRLQESFEERKAAISKAAVPDVVKVEQLHALADATAEVMEQLDKSLMAEVEKVKKLPQPAKGVADAGAVTKATAEKMAQAFRDGRP